LMRNFQCLRSASRTQPKRDRRGQGARKHMSAWNRHQSPPLKISFRPAVLDYFDLQARIMPKPDLKFEIWQDERWILQVSLAAQPPSRGSCGLVALSNSKRVSQFLRI
jgi:hypothetical protein